MIINDTQYDLKVTRSDVPFDALKTADLSEIIGKEFIKSGTAGKRQLVISFEPQELASLLLSTRSTIDVNNRTWESECHGTCDLDTSMLSQGYADVNREFIKQPVHNVIRTEAVTECAETGETFNNYEHVLSKVVSQVSTRGSAKPVETQDDAMLVDLSKVSFLLEETIPHRTQ